VTPTTIAYGDHPEQVLDLYRPDEPPRAVAVLVHGGFWRQMYERDLTAPLAERLAGRGYVVANIEYRRVGGDGGWPTTFTDAGQAVDHLATLADVPADRVVTVGHSAGGTIALWLAARHRLPDGAPGSAPAVRPIAALSLAGVNDLTHAADTRLGDGAPALALIGGSPDEAGHRYAHADPMRLLPTGVPTRLVHGADDESVPVAYSQRYADAARGAGDDAEVLVAAGEHMDVVDPDHALWRTAEAALDALAERTCP
jgi:acetyl esterase/lipase